MGDTAQQASSANKLILDIDQEPVILDDNPAHIEGVLKQADLYFQRTGQYAALFEQGAKVLQGGKLAVDSPSAVLFLDKTYHIPGKPAYSFLDPCPPTSARIKEYNEYADDQTALGSATPNFKEIKSIPSTIDNVISQEYLVRQDDSEVANIGRLSATAWASTASKNKGPTTWSNGDSPAMTAVVRTSGASEACRWEKGSAVPARAPGGTW